MRDNHKTVWVVGQNRAFTEKGLIWDIHGIFTSETEAIAACNNTYKFVGPVPLNVCFPEDVMNWPGAYYPSEMQEGICSTQ